MDKNQKKIDLTPSLTDASGREAGDSLEYVNKYGTYNIQPTADTFEFFPFISQGLGKRALEKLKEDSKD